MELIDVEKCKNTFIIIVVIVMRIKCNQNTLKKKQNLSFLKCKLRSYEDDERFIQARFKYSFTVSSVGKLR